MRRWDRVSTGDSDPLLTLRAAIESIRSAPADQEARRRLRALGAEGTWEPLALLLADEAKGAARPDIAAAFYEELADVRENLDQPMETIAAMEAVIELDPDDIERLDRLAWLYRKAGAPAKAAAMFERVASRAHDDRGRAALRAAGKLYRDVGKLDKAVAMYRVVVTRRPSDLEAWRALEDMLDKLQRWPDLAQVRGVLAERASDGIEKAQHLRGQARALDKAGKRDEAAALIAQAAQHAPDEVSGAIDYATVLVRDGKSRDAAQLIEKRIAHAIEAGASTDQLAGLRMHLARILDDDCKDPLAAAKIVDEVLVHAPSYLPALEWLAARAASDPDPRIHAAALLRYAQALPAGERAQVIAAAGRLLRDAGDRRGAVKAFEEANELAPEMIEAELADARVAVVVERALAELASGDVAASEKRLMAIVAANPRHVEANLALVDLLVGAERTDQAREHLRATLADAPDPSKLGRLVFRYAQLASDPDEAHQLLYEAHHLDRKNLAITIALGDSCAARKLWREAALHLGSVADHPEAGAHKAIVAAALMRAATAEIRALRPNNAVKHYEAATRIEPDATAAWHALAELATTRGDMTRAADCLEREAEATLDPATRHRLYDALGDLAHNVLVDHLRAERCWLQIADGNADILDKLLVAQRARNATTPRGETCEQLAELVPDRGPELHAEAAEAYLAGNEHDLAFSAARKLSVADAGKAAAIAMATGHPDHAARWIRGALIGPPDAELYRLLGDAERARGDAGRSDAAYTRAIELSPHALAQIGGGGALAWARQLVDRDPERARIAYELGLGLGGELTTTDTAFLADRPRAMAADEHYAAALEELDRRVIVDDPADEPLGELLDLVGEVAALLCPDPKAALTAAGLADAKRISPTSDIAAALVYPQIANALAGPQALVYMAATGPDVRVLVASPPVIVIGPGLAELELDLHNNGDDDRNAKLRFALGRAVELARWRRLFAQATFAEELWATFRDPQTNEGRLHASLSVAARRRITERLAPLESIDPSGYADGCERAADRSGLLACGRADIAVQLAPHLATIIAGERYAATRKLLTPRR